MMLFLNLTVFAGGKYLAKNFFANKSQIMIELLGNEFNQFLALSFKEKLNSLSLMISSVTPSDLKISQISRKLATWALGFSLCSPSNNYRCDHEVVSLNRLSSNTCSCSQK